MVKAPAAQHKATAGWVQDQGQRIGASAIRSGTKWRVFNPRGENSPVSGLRKGNLSER
jgi:hypothetical protein